MTHTQAPVLADSWFRMILKNLASGFHWHDAKSFRLGPGAQVNSIDPNGKATIRSMWWCDPDNPNPFRGPHSALNDSAPLCSHCPNRAWIATSLRHAPQSVAQLLSQPPAPQNEVFWRGVRGIGANLRDPDRFVYPSFRRKPESCACERK